MCLFVSPSLILDVANILPLLIKQNIIAMALYHVAAYTDMQSRYTLRTEKDDFRNLSYPYTLVASSMNVLCMGTIFNISKLCFLNFILFLFGNAFKGFLALVQ